MLDGKDYSFEEYSKLRELYEYKRSDKEEKNKNRE